MDNQLFSIFAYFLVIHFISDFVLDFDTDPIFSRFGLRLNR